MCGHTAEDLDMDRRKGEIPSAEERGEEVEGVWIGNGCGVGLNWDGWWGGSVDRAGVDMLSSVGVLPALLLLT